MVWLVREPAWSPRFSVHCLSAETRKAAAAKDPQPGDGDPRDEAVAPTSSGQVLLACEMQHKSTSTADEYPS